METDTCVANYRQKKIYTKPSDVIYQVNGLPPPPHSSQIFPGGENQNSVAGPASTATKSKLT